MNEPADPQSTPIRSLSRVQRRVLGTLIEKALTVPDSYPLTLNSLVSGCNQKSNRAPLCNFSEDDVADGVEELRDLGLATAVHTESGRTERYRHLFRKRFALSEPQVGILTELLLRGRQAMGELRSRASRLAPAGSLDSLEQLRAELQGLLDQKLIQSSGPLDRRGVEVDHALYEPREAQTLVYSETTEEPRETAGPSSPAASRAASQSAGEPQLAQLETDVARLRRELEAQVEANGRLRHDVDQLTDVVERLRREFGV